MEQHRSKRDIVGCMFPGMIQGMLVLSTSVLPSGVQEMGAGVLQY